MFHVINHINSMESENSKTQNKESMNGGGIIFTKYLNACLNDNSLGLKKRRSKKSDSDEKTTFVLKPDVNHVNEGVASNNISCLSEISEPKESCNPSTVVLNEEDGIDKYFSKFYEFKIVSSDRKLPSVSDFFAEEKWKVKELQDLKFRLNEVKGQLDNYNLSDWHRHTKSVNKAAEVQKYIRKHIDPELLTQAWCKFYEIVASTCLIPRKAVDDATLNSVHLCEAPGAFVASLNHYLKSKHPLITWNWLASTLNPYHEQNPHSCMINDDRLIYNTIDKWDFGNDCTGDLFNSSNMNHLVDKTKDYFNGDVLLVTSDGSFDCQSCPGEQEIMVSPLLYCEAITAISILKPGGSYLLKMFTMFECEIVCLLYLLYSLFGQVRVLKPVTSKEGNSEVYVVCLYFNPPEDFDSIHRVLISNYGFDITKKAMFGRDKIPEEFMMQLKECASFFEKQQENVINSNVKLFCNISDYERDEIRQLQDSIAKEYVRRYQLNPVPSYNYIVNHHRLKITPMLNMDVRFEEGSFSDLQKRSNWDLNIKLELIQKSINDIESRWSFSRNMLWFVISGENPVFSGISVGLPVSVVNNSKFCSGRLLKAYNETIELLGPICAKSHNKYSHPAMIICDVSNKPWSMKTWIAQKESLKDIMEVLKEMEDNSCLLLNGLPLLTQFNVGLVYLLGHAFEQVGFTNPKKSGYSVFFKGLKKTCLEYINLTFLEPIRQLNTNYKEAILSFFPIQNLCEDRLLYKVIVSTNHICLKNIINQRIEESLST